MNKIRTTAGLLALGAVSIDAQVFAPSGSSQQTTKPWTISAVLRGFYDDNYATAPKDREEDSFGAEFSPTASLNLLRDQTSLGLSYQYSLRWYEDRPRAEADHAHIVGAKLSHAFTPRYKIDLSDSFVIAQEPTLLSEDFIIPIRTEGDNLRNTAVVSFSAGVTENLDVVLGYENTYVDYEQTDSDVLDELGFAFGSRSSLLDRVEHLASINLRQVVLPNTVAIVGYNFGVVDYNSPGLIAPGMPADARDNVSHYIYAGVDQRLLRDLNASIRVGAQYVDFHKLDRAGLEDDSKWSPYVDANATWTYLPGSYAQLGVRHQRTATDVPTVGGALNPDAEATTVYGSINHRIFGSILASLIGQYQHSEFDAGNNSGDEDYFTAGVNLAYEINRFLAAEVGYNYDRLSSSDIITLTGQRSFTRNRVYAGIRATY